MEIPERWAVAIRSAGFGSLSALANEARMSTNQVVSVVCGAAALDDDSRKKLAAAMRLRPDELADLMVPLAGEATPSAPEPAPDTVPFVLPEGSEKLTPRQRAVVTELVLTFLEASQPTR